MKKHMYNIAAKSFFIFCLFCVHLSAQISGGSLDNTFGAGTGANGIVRAIAIQNNGKIVVGGEFTSYNGTSRNRIISVNTDGSIDNTFNPGTGANNTVNAIAIQSDGKAIIAGNFTSYNGTSINRIARLNIDGSLDNTFSIGTGANNQIYALTLQSDGKIIIGGNFTSYNGTNINRIVRLNTNGSLDNTYNVGTGVNNEVRKIVLQADGKSIVVGNFSSYNGTGRVRIVRINTDGSLDNTFNPGTGAVNDYFNPSTIYDAVLQSDGKMIIAGQFTSYNGTGKHSVARINTDGSLDNTFNPGTGIGNNWGVGLYAVVLQPNGEVIIGGNFSSFDGKVKNGISRLNSNGSVDESFDVGTGAEGEWGQAASVYALNIHSTDKLLFAGDFVKYRQVSINRIGRIHLGSINCINTTGTDVINKCSSYTWINGVTYSSSNNTATYIIPNAAGCDSLISLNLTITRTFGVDIQKACDSYTWINGMTYTTSNSIAKDTLQNFSGCDSVVTLNLTITKNTGTDVKTVCDSLIWINGVTYKANNNTAKYTVTDFSGCDSVITLNLTVKKSTTVLYDQTSYNSYTWMNGTTYTSSNTTDKYILTNSVGCDSIIKLNLTINPDLGTYDYSFKTGSSGFDDQVLCLASQPDGKIIAGGVFTKYNNVSRNCIVRINSDGSLDPSFNPGLGVTEASPIVRAITVQSDGKILIGGGIYKYNGVSPGSDIIRLNKNGTWDNTFNFVQASIYSITQQANGKIIVTRGASTVNGASIAPVYRINSDGSTDNTFSVATAQGGGVFASALQADGKILIGGQFLSVNDISSSKIARLNVDGSLDQTFNIGSGVSGVSTKVYAICVQPDGKIIIGGELPSYNGVTINNIARLNPDGSLDTTFIIGLGVQSTSTGPVRSICLLPSGKILIGGSFTKYDGVNRTNIARLNSNGTLDKTFNPQPSVNAAVMAGILHANGKWLIGGSFTSYNGKTQNRLVQIHVGNDLDCFINNCYIEISNSALFNAVLLHNPDIDADGDKRISIEEAALISTLNLSGKNLTTIEGLEQFTNLTTLDLSNNDIGDMDVSGLSKLNILNVTGNPQLYVVCVNQNQMNNKVSQWSKENYTQWNTGNCNVTTSINNDSNSQFVPAYPNPADNVIFLSEKIRGIYTICGELVKVKNIADSQIELDNVSSGVYFIHYGSGRMEKLIIK